jgi:hypothetical protein
MRTRRSAGSVAWILAGVLFLVLLLAIAWHFRRDEGSAGKLASKATRVDLVARLELDLVSAAEAEKSSVLAITDEESERFADQARAATAQLESERQELGSLLATDQFARERDLFAQFTKAFGDLRRVDQEVLTLAVKNTNIKAYSLLFGPVADAETEMDSALARIGVRYADSTDGKKVMVLSDGARIGVLRIQALLAPHIAEASDAKMDQLEAVINQEEAQVRSDLIGLAGLAKLAGDPDLATAMARFDQFRELKARILPLSRENTNVRSLALSLNEKRKAMIVCLDALASLKQAIFEEPIVGVDYGRPQRPR